MWIPEPIISEAPSPLGASKDETLFIDHLKHSVSAIPLLVGYTRQADRHFCGDQGGAANTVVLACVVRGRSSRSTR